MSRGNLLCRQVIFLNTIIFVTFLILSPSIYSEIVDSRYAKFTEVLTGLYLNLTSKVALRTPSLLHCTQKCLNKNASCNAVNFKKNSNNTENNCHLLFVSTGVVQETFTRNSDWIYLEEGRPLSERVSVLTDTCKWRIEMRYKVITDNAFISCCSNEVFKLMLHTSFLDWYVCVRFD